MKRERKTKVCTALAVGFLLLANTASAQTLTKEEKYQCMGKLMGAIKYQDSTSVENGRFVKQNQKDIDRIDPLLNRMSACVKGEESRLSQCRGSLPKEDQYFWDQLMIGADIYERARQRNKSTANLVLVLCKPDRK